MGTMTDEEAIALLRARHAANAATGTTATCVHCGEPIVFRPYFLDGKSPNPPVWWHPWPDRLGGLGGGFTCNTRPEGWAGDSWPRATPPSEAS